MTSNEWLVCPYCGMSTWFKDRCALPGCEGNKPLSDAAGRNWETDSHDDPGEVSPANEDHRIVYVEPGASAFIQAVCACGEHLTGSGTTSISTLLAAHIREASPASDAVRDLAASPGATDPRILMPAEHMALTVGLAQIRRGEPMTSNIAGFLALALERIAAADAADRAADPPWIRVRCDEATVEWLARWWFINESADTAKEWDSGRYSGKPMWRRRARVMLAALQEAEGSSDQTVNPGDDPLPIGEFAPDRAAGIVCVDTRDEALKDAVYDWITDGYHADDSDLLYHIGLVFQALVALRGEQ